MSAIFSTIGTRLVVDGGFVVFDVRSFAWSELSGTNSLIDPVLLAILTRIDAHALGVRRSSVVYRRIITAIDPGRLHVRNLVRRAAEMLLIHRGTFAGSRSRLDTALAVEAGMVVFTSTDEAAILVDAVKARADMPRRRVVQEVSAVPASAVESNAAVAEPIVNSAVESHVRSPIAPVPSIGAAHKSPVAGRPKQTGMWGCDPQAGSPEVASRTVAPVAGRPQKSFGRAGRLLINRQGRRSHRNRYTDANLRVRYRGHGKKQCKEHKIASPLERSHLGNPPFSGPLPTAPKAAGHRQANYAEYDTKPGFGSHKICAALSNIANPLGSKKFR